MVFTYFCSGSKLIKSPLVLNINFSKAQTGPECGLLLGLLGSVASSSFCFYSLLRLSLNTKKKTQKKTHSTKNWKRPLSPWPLTREGVNVLDPKETVSVWKSPRGVRSDILRRLWFLPSFVPSFSEALAVTHGSQPGKSTALFLSSLHHS